MKVQKFFVVFILMLFLITCGKESAKYPMMAKEKTLASTYLDEEVSQDKTLETGRKIIKTASVSFYVDDLNKSMKAIEKMTLEYNGLIANKTIYQESKKDINGSLTVWIPSEKLMEFVDKVAKIGKLNYSNISTQDITETYFDLETRVRNKRKQEERLLQLLDRRDTKLQDILALEQELARIRIEIESIEGKKRLWDRQIQYSTVNINLTQDIEAIKEPENIFKPLVRAFRKIKDIFLFSFSIIIHLIAFIINSIVFLLPWILVFVIILILYKLIRKSSKRE
jgi:hypothetical protein